MTTRRSARLDRVLGLHTTLLVGLGVAIGSGILRTPPLVAAELGSAGAVLLAWGLGGLVILASSLVMAELATRFPESGGEYAWLREAYGPFVAFFFGWGYTIFMVGGGAATIAAAFGDVAAELFGALSARGWAGVAVLVVVLANMLGLRAGAFLQNGLTIVKLAIVLGIGALGVLAALRPEPSGDLGSPTSPASVLAAGDPFSLRAWVAALPPVIWAYAGSTDAVKLSGEVERPSVRIPIALVGATGILAIIYLVVNGGLLFGLGVEGLARSSIPAAELAERVFGRTGATVAAAGAAIVFLGALSSTLLATVRVAWALGSDGYGFGFMGRMSRRQAPVGALAFVGAIALTFALARNFEEILGIYFLAGAILFGLVYASLLVFRARDGRLGVPEGVFRCPAPRALVGALILVQAGMAVYLTVSAPRDAAATFGLLALVALAYLAVRGGGKTGQLSA